MAYLGFSILFPTRMVVARLANEDLFLWSPTQPDGKAPIDLRLTFLGGKDAARASFDG